MDPERRLVIVDLLIGSYLVYMAAAIGAPLSAPPGIVVGALGAVAVAYVSEHTGLFDGLVEDLGPHRVAVILFAVGLGATIAAIWGLVPLPSEGVSGAVLGYALASLTYRAMFGIVGPLPPRVKSRVRASSNES